MRLLKLSALAGACFLASFAVQDRSAMFPEHKLGFRVQYDDWATFQPDNETAWNALSRVDLSMERAVQIAEAFAISRYGAESVRVVSCELAYAIESHPVYSIVLYATWFNTKSEKQVYIKYIAKIGSKSHGVKFWRIAERFPGTPIRGEVLALDSGILTHDIRVGDGQQVASDSKVKVHFQLRTLDGSIVLDTYEQSRPKIFRLEEGPVRGFGEGLVGARVGGKRKVIVPPHLGYGAGTGLEGTVPANATLVFDIEVLGIILD